MQNLDIHQQLKKLHLKPNKDLGQHFLIDESILETIINSYFEIGGVESDTIVEIGPGLGILTEQLAKFFKRVITIELDQQFKPILLLLAEKYKNIEIVYNDALRVNYANYGLKSKEFSIIANLPYQITGSFLRKMITQSPMPKHMVLLIQQEVAKRIVAKSGQMSILALSIQAFAEPQLISVVPATAFFPKPAVTSAIIAIKNIRKRSIFTAKEEEFFFRLIKVGFSAKRKYLISNLYNNQMPKTSLISLKKIFTNSGILLQARAQELSLEQWAMLVDKFKFFMI